MRIIDGFFDEHGKRRGDPDEYRVLATTTTPLPAPLWVKGETAFGAIVEGVAIALLRVELERTDRELTPDTPLSERDERRYYWVVLDTEGNVSEVDTSKTSRVLPHDGDPYAAHLAGLGAEDRA